MKKEKDIKIVIATHKKYAMPSDSIYIPLHVGASGKNVDFGYVKDDIGDNISCLNPSFCELTGLYWAWKNLKDDYIGLAHYRRHFCAKIKSKNPVENVLTQKEADDLLETYDVIVPQKRRYYIESLYSHYKHTHYASQLDETRKIIERLHPNYVNDYDCVVKRRWGYMFNMMIMRKTLLDEYCTWLFSILFELKERVESGRVKDSVNLSSFQGRFYGRISEILFNVWLEYQLKNNRISSVKELQCISMEKIDWNRKIKSFLAAKFFGKKYEGSF